MKTRARARSGFSWKLRTWSTGSPATQPTGPPVSIQPYWGSGPVGVAVDEGGHPHHVAHERRLLADEVIGREQAQDRVGIPLRDPVRGEEHGHPRPPFLRLQQEGRAWDAEKLLAEVVLVASTAHHDRALERDPERQPIHGLSQHRTRAQEARVLLGSLVAAEIAGETPEPHPVAAGEDHPPEPARLPLDREHFGWGLRLNASAHAGHVSPPPGRQRAWRGP